MDLLLGDNHDIVFENGATPVTQTKVDVVAQRLHITLQTFLGEWFLDTQLGVPYFQRIFGKVKSTTTVDAIFQEKIASDPDVVNILEYSSSLDNTLRRFTIKFKVSVVDGDTTDTITIVMEK